MLPSTPPPPLTELHLGPLWLTVFGLVVAAAVLVGLDLTRRRDHVAVPELLAP